MELELWGATSNPALALPERSLGYLLLAFYAILFAFLLFTRRQDLLQLRRRQWGISLGLAISGVILSQLFLVSVSTENQLPPYSTTQNPVAYLAPFVFVPFLLAGTTLNPLIALLVGFSTGLGRALWQTHQLTEPFQYAFAAIVASYLLQQLYSGRLYEWLRKPIISGVFGGLSLLPLIGLATFAYSNPAASYLEALDMALSTTRANILPSLLEGLFAGAIVSVILIGLPQLKQERASKASPLSLSLNTRMVATFIIFAGLLSFLLIVVGFDLAIKLSTDLAVEQMARDVQAVTARIPNFRDDRQYLLTRTSEIEALRSGNTAAQRAVLEQLFLSGPFYRSIYLVDLEGNIVTGVPNVMPEGLTKFERLAIEEAINNRNPIFSPAQELNDGTFVFSIIIPVLNKENKPSGVLVGRVPDVALEELVGALQGTLGQGVGFLIDEEGKIIAHPDDSNLLKTWSPPESQPQLSDDGLIQGYVFLGPQGDTNTRQLVYYQLGPDHPWQIAITIPYERILGQALTIAGQLAVVLLLAMLVTAGFLLLLGRSVTRPLMDLLQASQEIASGRLNTTINPQGDDEIGRLGHAFGQMQLSLKRRLDELSLLLLVSQDVSTSIDLHQGMPAILKGALRGTGASGARVVVLNPSGKQPLSYGEGPANDKMAKSDWDIMKLLRLQKELVLPDQQEVQRALQNDDPSSDLLQALVALPLITRDRFQGIFWLTYRQPHQVDNIEMSFLRTLSSQAAVLVENARLYAMAEGGRRRLAAVLSSTSDAVIVTDQSERILLINPATEQHFKLDAEEVTNRRVRDVIQSKPLVKALTANTNKTQHAEIQTEDGRVLYTNASVILNNEGLAIGRVAVMRDITYLKELDELKSEFVATVSHDLRSPLTYMQGYATMLPMVGDLEPKQEEYVGKIIGGIKQMSGLVDDLLDLGRLEAGEDLKLSNVNIPELLGLVQEEYDQPARQNGIKLIVRSNGDIPTIHADQSLLRQAVSNYVNNAIKYAPNSGDVLMFTEREGEDVVIGVIDNGPGISGEDQLRLFEKFFRVQDKSQSKVKGSGLGLSLVKSIANRHGGRAWCESRIGVGSAFYISLPIMNPRTKEQ